MKFNYINTPEKWKEAKDFLETQPRLGIDKESSVRDEWRGKKVSALNIQVSQIEITSIKADEEYPFVVDHRILKEKWEFVPDLPDLFQKKDFVAGARIKFDLKLFYHLYGIWLTNARDIQLMSRMIGNATGSKFASAHGHSLGDLCRDWLNIHLEGKGEKLQASDWGLPLSQRDLDNPYWYEKLAYAAGDTEYLLPLHDQMFPVICNPLPKTPLIPNGTENDEEIGLGMRDAFDMEMKAIPVTACMEYNGIPTSYNILSGVQKAIKKNLEEDALDLALYFKLPIEKSGDPLSSKKSASQKAQKTLNNPQALLKLIRENFELYNIDNTQTAVLERTLDIMDKVYQERSSDGGDNRSSSIQISNENEQGLYDQLQMYEHSLIYESIPILRKIVDYRRLKKLEGMDLRKYINPATGRIHCNMNQIGTATSRFSCIAKGQRVKMVEGYKPIEEIVKGESVYCLNKIGDLVISTVTEWFDNGSRPTMRIQLGHPKGYYYGVLRCTLDHKILKGEKGDGKWVLAKHLLPGDIVAGEHGKLYVYFIDLQDSESCQVYDLGIETHHNYVCEGVITSNSSTPNLQQIAARTKLDIPIEVEEDGTIVR